MSSRCASVTQRASADLSAKFQSDPAPSRQRFSRAGIPYCSASRAVWSMRVDVSMATRLWLDCAASGVQARLQVRRLAVYDNVAMALEGIHPAPNACAVLHTVGGLRALLPAPAAP